MASRTGITGIVITGMLAFGFLTFLMGVLIGMNVSTLPPAIQGSDEDAGKRLSEHAAKHDGGPEKCL